MSALSTSQNSKLLAFLVWNALLQPARLVRGNANLPMHLPSFAIKHASIIGDVFGGVIVIVLGSSLFGVVANFTTGITVAHTGFTPNVNITQSIGFVPIVQLIPFLFGAMILLMVYAIFEKHLPGGL